VSEAREIPEVNQFNKKEKSRIKTHDEIIELLKEIESIEDKLKSTETIADTPVLPTFVEIENPEIPGELSKETQSQEIQTESELTEKIRIQKKEKQKRKIHFTSKLRRKIKPNGRLKPSSSTFTLRIDDQSNLVGFNIKKPKPKAESKHRQILPFKKGTPNKSGDEKTTEELGIKGKIKGIFSQIKPKSYSEEGGSLISNALGKIRDIFSRS
jgi:hypothetical protein